MQCKCQAVPAAFLSVGWRDEVMVDSNEFPPSYNTSQSLAPIVLDSNGNVSQPVTNTDQYVVGDPYQATVAQDMSAGISLAMSAWLWQDHFANPYFQNTVLTTSIKSGSFTVPSE
jgi:hypothetical protein